MNCGDYQQDILLLIHGELGFVDRIRVQAHLSRCADCRKKRDSLAAASRAIGAAVRPPESAPWSPPSAARSRRIPSTRLIAAVVFLLASSAYLAFTIYRNQRDSCSLPVPAATAAKCPTCTPPNVSTGVRK
jgi:hypothetical protein